MTTEPTGEDPQRHIPSVLACDVGNTAVRIAHVRGEEIGGLRRFRVGELGELGRALHELWSEMPEPRKIVAASVNPSALKALEAAAAEAIEREVILIGRDIPAPIDTDLEATESVGMDRLCAAVAAFDRLGIGCVVADFGTAVTVDCVSDEGVFLGGAVLPGLSLQAKALHEYTAALPRVEPGEPDGVFGKNTEQALRAGLVMGARGALRGLVESYAEALGHWPVVVVTGGDADLVARPLLEAGLVQAIVEDLTLRGVAMGYYRTLLPEK